MRLPKSVRQPHFEGTNQAVLMLQFQKNMELAEKMEEELESVHIKHEDKKLKIVISAKPRMVEMTFKQNVDAEYLMTVINELIAKAHDYRKEQADKIVYKKPGGRR